MPDNHSSALKCRRSQQALPTCNALQCTGRSVQASFVAGCHMYSVKAQHTYPRLSWQGRVTHCCVTITHSLLLQTADNRAQKSCLAVAQGPWSQPVMLAPVLISRTMMLGVTRPGQTDSRLVEAAGSGSVLARPLLLSI